MLQQGHIRLRIPAASDKKRIAELVNNRKIWLNVRDLLPYPYYESDSETFLESIKDENPPVTFAIELDSNLVGMIGLALQTDVYERTAEIGYWIGEPYWGNGIATTAVELICKYGFEKLDLLRIHTGVFQNNTASMKVLEKNGFAKDGIFKKNIVKDNIILDEHRYSKTI